MGNDVRQEIKFVDQFIGELAGELAANNKGLEKKLVTEIREIILQNDLRSSSEETSSILRILSDKNSEVDTETIVKAKEAVLKLSRLPAGSVRAYRGEDFKTNLVEETIKVNPTITEEQIKTVRNLADNVNKVYNSDGGIENQKDAVLAENADTSIGKVKNAWNDTQGINGLLKQKPKQFKEIVDNHEKITAELQKHNIKIPYNNQKFDNLNSYDRVMSSIKNPEMRRFIESSRSRFQTLERITKGRFSQRANSLVNRINGGGLRNVANNFFNKSIVNISNGFASKIGNQAVKNFVQNSVGSILKNSGLGGLKSVMQGAMKKGAQMAGKAAMNVAAKLGLKAATLGLKAAFGAATAGIGAIALAAWKGIKLIGKFFGKLFEGLNLELTNSKFANTVIIIILVIFVLLFGMGTATADNVSSLVPTIETIGGNTHGEVTYTEDNRIRDCGVGMEVDFDRNKNKTMVTPEKLKNNIKEYNKQLKDSIGEQFGTRCGVVYAADYLADDFEYWVPYWFGGVWPYGSLNPRWGEDPAVIGFDENNEEGQRRGYGLDCAGFREWVQYSGIGKLTVNNKEYPVGSSNCETIKNLIEPGDGFVIRNRGYHFALVMAYEGNTVKFAHSGGGSGVSTGLINMCTGKGIDNGMQFDFFQKRGF